MSGHLTDDVFSRYNIQAVDDLKDAAQKIEEGAARTRAPTRKPTFPKTHLRNRGRCCSRKWCYFFQAERLESFTPGWRNWQTQRTQKR
jgi:hypothetical protein